MKLDSMNLELFIKGLTSLGITNYDVKNIITNKEGLCSFDIVFKEEVNNEEIQELITNHDPTSVTKPLSTEDYLLGLDFRISSIELGI